MKKKETINFTHTINRNFISICLESMNIGKTDNEIKGILEEYIIRINIYRKLDNISNSEVEEIINSDIKKEFINEADYKIIDLIIEEAKCINELPDSLSNQGESNIIRIIKEISILIPLSSLDINEIVSSKKNIK